MPMEIIKTKVITFGQIISNHTIEATFVREPSPPGDEYMRMFVKRDGVWVPLFT